jgi:hypothetical protein
MNDQNEQIALADRNRVVRIRLGMWDTNNCPYLSLCDDAGLERIQLQLSQEGNGSLAFLAANGHPIMSLGVSSELGAGMSVLDYENDTVFELTIAKGSGVVRLSSKDGSFTWPPLGKE